MSNVTSITNEHKTAATIESFLIEGWGAEFEVAPAIVDLDVFEHIDKPYLTAAAGFLDFDNVFEIIKISGGEKVSIKVKSTHELAEEINKTFYIDRVVSSDKIQSDQEFYVIHLIEDIGFFGVTKNINKSYSGYGSDIISKISKDYLNNKEVAVEGISNENEAMKVIIPNMNPIDALCWIKNRLVTDENYPYYLFSSLVEKNLHLSDLNYLLSQPVLNPDIPYVFAESSVSHTAAMGPVQRRIILSYKGRNTDNVFKLLDAGAIGSRYEYIDVTKKSETKKEFELDVEDDIIDRFKKDKLVYNSPTIDMSKYDWYGEEGVTSKKITQIGGTTSYENYKSYSECDGKSQYKARVVSNAMANIITKNSIDITVNGYDFLDGLRNTSIGCKLRILFLTNQIPEEKENGSVDTQFDHKKSGDFLIMGCKHSFSEESYTISMSAVKVDQDMPEINTQ